MELSATAQKIFRKPPLLVIVPIVYFFLIIFSKWHLALPIGSLLFFLGGLLGIYLLDIAEEIFAVKPSPFRTMMFVIGLGIIGFYTITSTREMAASGLVLGLMVTIFLYQVSEWKIRKNLDSWYQMFFEGMSQTGQKIGLFVYAFVLLFETFLFITG